jgi:hypothetical protein
MAIMDRCIGAFEFFFVSRFLLADALLENKNFNDELRAILLGGDANQHLAT